MTDYRDDIEKYLAGKLTSAERNALERKALHDPFLADALEGAEQINASEFSNDVNSLESQIASKNTPSVWAWPARIAAGLAIIAASSFIIWTLMRPDPAQDLAFQESKPETVESTPTDSVSPTTNELSSPPAEQPKAGPEKDIATRSQPILKIETKPKQEAAGETVLKTEPVTDAVVAEEKKAEIAKSEDISVTEPVAQAKAIEKEAEISRAKADDVQESKVISKKKAAAPSVADKSGAGLDSYLSSNVIRGHVTSADDGSPLPGVNVVIKNTTIGTVTDSQGNYQINGSDSNPTLVYSFIGLQSTEVKAEKNEVDVQMTLDNTQLSEVVVTAYGVESGGYVAPVVNLAHAEIGNRAYKQYLENNIRYPEQAKLNKVEGRVTVQFTVETNGSLTNFIVIRGIGSGCDEELIRLIKEGPKWIPTRKDDVPVKDKAKVRLKFELP